MLNWKDNETFLAYRARNNSKDHTTARQKSTSSETSHKSTSSFRSIFSTEARVEAEKKRVAAVLAKGH